MFNIEPRCTACEIGQGRKCECYTLSPGIWAVIAVVIVACIAAAVWGM